MDVKIEAACMAADAEMTNTIVRAIAVIINKVIALITQVASSSCLSIGGTSISAVSPDHILTEGTALAVA